MRSIPIQIVSFYTFGAVLAVVSIQCSFSTGVIGAMCLIAYSKLMKRRWAAPNESLQHEFSHCEQALRIRLAANTLLLGHLATALLHTHVDMRLGQGSSLAIDSWIMIAAALTTEYIFKNDTKIIDERDLEYSANAIAWGYRCLALLVVLFALFLALTPPNLRTLFSHFLIGNALVAFCLASYCVYVAVRLCAYSRDRIEIQNLSDET